MRRVLLVLLRLYQLTLSRLLLALFGPVCRFEPSCSAYAIACVRDHGALRGSLLSARRLCKCHPFHPGGFDPPPPPPRALEGRPTDRVDADPAGGAPAQADGPPPPTHASRREPSTGVSRRAGPPGSDAERAPGFSSPPGAPHAAAQ